MAWASWVVVKPPRMASLVFGRGSDMRLQLAINAVERLERGEVAAGRERPLNDRSGLRPAAFGKQGPQVGKKFGKNLRLFIGRGSQVLLQGSIRI